MGLTATLRRLHYSAHMLKGILRGRGGKGRRS